MNHHKSARRLGMAIAWAEEARRAALRRVRAAGDPRNPYRARAGFEQGFDAGKKDAFALELVLAELKARRRAKRTDAALRAADRALDVLIGVGLVLLGALGVAAALLLLRAPDIAVRVTTVAGVALIAAREIVKRKRAKPPIERAASCGECPIRGKERDAERLGRFLEEVDEYTTESTRDHTSQ